MEVQLQQSSRQQQQQGVNNNHDLEQLPWSPIPSGDTIYSTLKSLTRHFSSPALSSVSTTDHQSSEAEEKSAGQNRQYYNTLGPQLLGNHSTWTLGDTDKNKRRGIKLPLSSFNHIAREVRNLEKSKEFYVDILGFDVVPRPAFNCQGYWLSGYGLSLHLVLTTVPDERKRVKINRIRHFSSALPRVDHCAFITADIMYVKSILDEQKVYYKYVIGPVGIQQIFLFDPDGNVIEVSNCEAGLDDDGEVMCQLHESTARGWENPSTQQSLNPSLNGSMDSHACETDKDSIFVTGSSGMSDIGLNDANVSGGFYDDDFDNDHHTLHQHHTTPINKTN